MRSNEPQKWDCLKPGQAVILRPDSKLYRGPYDSEILDVREGLVRITVPTEEGRLVLLPVGTELLLASADIHDAEPFEVRVAERRTGAERHIVLEFLPEVPQEEGLQIPVWAVTSGKGGVGKTTVVVNLAIALAELGKRVCIIDGDLGTANVDVVLNLTPQYTLTDVVGERRHILEVLVEGPRGVIVLPGGSGLQELTELREESFAALIAQFKVLERYTDLILIDTTSGLSRSVTNFIVAANESILVTTPEPPAITDAYALLKVLTRAGHERPMRLLVNRAQSMQDGEDVADKMVFAARRFLQYELDVLGFVNEDEQVGKAVRQQVPVILASPRALATQQFREIAAQLLGLEAALSTKEGGTRGFLQRLRSLWHRPSSKE